MKNNIQLTKKVTSVINDTKNVWQAKRPPYKRTLVTTVLVLLLSTVWAGASGTWSPTGSMSIGRFSFTATLLQNGKVLVAGGDTPGEIITNTAELYDPATGRFTRTANMHQARVGFSATLLQNGQVLVEGGASNTQEALKTAEIYDPTTSTWTLTGAMKEGRQQHSAVLLQDGRVLVTGGNIDRTPCADLCVNTITESELYDPSTGQWKTVGEMTIARSFFTTNLLPTGNVIAAGGRIHTGPDYFDFHAIAWADLYDPATKKWSATGTMSVSREDHSTSLLGNGQVLVAGGSTVDFNGITVASAELYDSTTGAWTVTGSMLQGRESFTATLLQNGQVLVAGGDYYDGINAGDLSECELYDPTLGTWSVTGSMATPRDGESAVLLADGRVLTAGGSSNFNYIALAEVYTP